MQKLPPVNDPALKPWTRAVEKILAGSELEMRGVGSRLNSQSQALDNVAGLAPEVKTVTQIPQAPRGLAVDAVWAWTATGQLSITLKVSWNEVLLDLNDGFVVDPSYEVWVGTDTAPSKRINSTEDTRVDITDQPIDSDFYVKVRAVTRKGSAGQFSGEALVVHPALGDLAELGRPSMPTLASSNGVVVVHWDGESGAGDILPPYFSHVAVAMSSTQNGDYVYVGQQLQQAGSVVVASEPIGAARWFKLVAFDRLGRVSDASDPALITVVGVDLGPLQQDLDDAEAAVAQAQTDVAAAQTAIGNMQGDISDALSMAGAAITATTDEYAVSASATVAPTTGWSVATPDWSAGNYIWRRVSTTNGDGTVVKGAPAVLTGNTGAAGTPGTAGTSATSVTVGNGAVTIPTDNAGATVAASTIVIPFAGWVGNTRAAATIAASTLPAGITAGTNTAATASADGSLTLNVANASTLGGATSGNITLTITTNGRAFTVLLAWAKALAGANGSPGSPGSNGASVSTVTRYYTLQASSTAPAAPTVSPPPAPWTTTEPGYTAGSTQYLFFVDRTVLSTGAFSYSAVSLSSSFEAGKAAYARADSALTAANGKNQITYSTAIPSDTTNAGTRAGDIWFRRDGTGVIIAQYEWSGTTWTARTIDNAVIANIDAGKITAGTINAARIGSRTITADKLIIADVTNNVADPDFTYGTAQWSLAAGATVATISDPPAGIDATKALQMVANATVLDTQTITPVPVRPGQQWYAEMWIRRVGTMVDTTGTIQLGATVNRPAANGGTIWPTFVSVTPADITTAWQRLSGVVTIPDFGTTLQVRPSIRADVADGTFQMTEFVLRRMVGGELLVDGTITATKIAANSITSEQMAANSISAEEIAAGAVVAAKISAGAVTANAIAAGAIQANHIAAGTITTTQLAAGIGGQLDITANQAITLVAGQASAAQTTADNASQGLADMQTVYNFGATGATISSPNSPLSLALKSDRIEIQSNGNAVSTWTSGQMKVDSFVGTTVELGNHKLEKYTSGGTVVRALN